MERHRRSRWRDARHLLDTFDGGPPARTFPIADVLASHQSSRALRRIRRSPEGKELLEVQPKLDAQSLDLHDLLRLPHRTFGHEVAEWMLQCGFAPGSPTTDRTDRAYLERRLLEVHDLWHVLTGYNCDLPGELGLLAFTLGQGHGRGIRALLAVAVWRDLRESWMRRGRPWSPLISYLLTAYLRGRHARSLAPVYLEHSLALPIDSVRQRLAIEPCVRSLRPDSLPPISLRPPRELGLLPH